MKHIKTTIHVTELRSEPEHLEKLLRYAWKRYMLAWSAKHYRMADTAFAAVERCERLQRLLAA